MVHHPAWVGHHTAGPSRNPQHTRAHFGGEAVGSSPTAHKCHGSTSPSDDKGRTLRQHGSGASFRSTEQHKVTQVSKEEDVIDSQPAVQKTAGPTEGEADWTIVYKVEHEEEFLQHEDEVAMKVIIDKASTLLSVVTTGKGPTEGFDSQETSECPDRLLSHCFQGSTWTARGGKVDWHGATFACNPKESFVNKRHHTIVVAPGHRGFIQIMTTGALHAETGHILVPADTRIISMRVH